METTLTAVALAADHAYVAHVGDSRVYHWRGGRLAQLTADHSEAAELVRLKVLSPDRLNDHPGRNILTRTLGGRLIVRPDFLRQVVQPGDRLLLCSDGLWSEVSGEEMSVALKRCGPVDACRELMDLALERECRDNASLQVIYVHSVTPNVEPGHARDGWLSGIFSRIGKR